MPERNILLWQILLKKLPATPKGYRKTFLFQAVGIRQSLHFLQVNAGEVQFECAQTAQLQAGIGIGNADGEDHGDGVCAHIHKEHICALAGEVVAAELDITGCGAGEGVGDLIGLAGHGGEVVLQLHLPPVACGIGGDQLHGGGGVLTDDGDQRTFVPGLVTLETIGFTAGASQN